MAGKSWLWTIWGLASLALAGWLGYTLVFADDKTQFLIGEASHGHYQIEMACESCHSEPFGGDEVLQDACIQCHGDELKAARDSHPAKKFTDPREADRLEVLDARYCVTCHREHQQEQTHAMGLTLPEDYCWHCHQEVTEERDSHEGLAFDSCASAGCHNFHDNRALYERFLVENAGQPWLNPLPHVAAANHATTRARRSSPGAPATLMQRQAHPRIATMHDTHAHGTAGLPCAACHQQNSGDDWLPKPGIEQCQSCHAGEAEGFMAGKHGMRLSGKLDAALSPVQPGDARLPFHAEADTLSHGCNSCHSAHEFDRREAAVEACLGCHADEHSLAFLSSPHGQLWQEAETGLRPAEEAVSCATCHMPRLITDQKNASGEAIVQVQHNQNDNLRPNEKMIRPVCMQCHGLGFAIDALADETLINNNFSGKPGAHVPSIDWAKDRE